MSPHPPRRFNPEIIMTRFFKLASLRLLRMGGAKASTQGPTFGNDLEDEIVRYQA
jgi:hypothetical protein